MTMTSMHELKDMMCRELENIAQKRQINRGDAEDIKNMTGSIKNILEIEKMDGEDGDSQHGRYGRSGGWEARGFFGRPYDDDGDSYTRRGEHYVRGHYSREDDTRRPYNRKERDMYDELDDMTYGDEQSARRMMGNIRR